MKPGKFDVIGLGTGRNYASIDFPNCPAVRELPTKVGIDFLGHLVLGLVAKLVTMQGLDKELRVDFTGHDGEDSSCVLGAREIAKIAEVGHL